MHTIKLNKQIWQINTSKVLGSPGGFGEVFRGSGQSGEVAIKRLNVTASEAAHRELQIGRALSERSLKHIVPILDYGQDADSDRYYIVMPICDRSLQDSVNDKGNFSAHESIEILLAILTGLAEVPDITHRDIKPPNILMHESKWKIADFGIAKFVEDSTSLETLRTSLTPAYAAPEQWLLQRPTSATDIYATGCIAHVLLTGKPPFPGDMDSLREKHLNETPQSLNNLPASARSLVSHMMRKNPEIRPKLNRCMDVFQKALETDDQPIRDVDAKFAEAVNELSIKQAREEAAQRERDNRRRNRDNIFNEAARELNQIKKRLFGEIKERAQGVIESISNDSSITIGHAKLELDTSIASHGLNGIKKSDPEQMAGDGGWGVHKKQSDWDLIAYTTISILQIIDGQEYKRCANIVFGRPNENSDYRWYEMGFFSISSHRSGGQEAEPFCLDYAWEIDKALSKVMDAINLAYTPAPIDGEDEDSFIELWMGIVAQAMVGNLTRPSGMPMAR